MALINCPECGKEISDKAVTCPNCGYGVARKSNSQISLADMISKNKKNILIVCAIVAALIVIVLFATHTNTSNPFKKLDRGMSQEEVHKAYGQPNDSSDYKEYSILTDKYTNVNLCGVNGTLTVWYAYKKKTVSYAVWEKSIPNDKDFDDYDKEILKIKKGLAKICGNEEDFLKDEWEDVAGNEYRLELKKGSSSLLSEIQVWFDPD